MRIDAAFASVLAVVPVIAVPANAATSDAPTALPIVVPVEDLLASQERPTMVPSRMTASYLVSVQVGTEFAGTWISVWLHPGPLPVLGWDEENTDGWMQVQSYGGALVQIPADVAPGSYTIVAQSADGTVLGWRALEIEAPPVEPGVDVELADPDVFGAPTSARVRVSAPEPGMPMPEGAVDIVVMAGLNGPSNFTAQYFRGYLDSAGKATIALTPDLGPGQYDLTFIYHGDNFFDNVQQVRFTSFTVIEQYPVVAGVGTTQTEAVMTGLSRVFTTQSWGTWGVISHSGSGGLLVRSRSGTNVFLRPTTSESAIAALSQSAVGGSISGVSVAGAVDFARSIVGPSPALPGDDLTFVPHAKDALTFGVLGSSAFPRDIALGALSQDTMSPAPFTLRNIYRGVITTYVDDDFANVPIEPMLPPVGTEARDWWLESLGLSEADLGADVESLPQPAYSGLSLKTPGEILPVSVANWVAQGNHSWLPSRVDEQRGFVELGSIDTVRPVVYGVFGIHANPSFPVSRLLFNVVETARLTGTSTQDALLQYVFASGASPLCGRADVTTAYGYAPIGSLCGNTTLYRQAFALD